MAKYEATDLRNLTLCGQMGAGKTMLAEAMMFKAGATNRLGKVTDGTTLSDFEPEEKSHQYSIRPAVLHCNHAKREFNIIDTPGSLEFYGGQVGGIAGGDTAVICVNAQKGIEVITRKAWEVAGEMGKARVLVITRLDAENVNYEEVLASIQKTFGSKCVPFVIPQGEGQELAGVVPIFGSEIPGDLADQAESLRSEITENAVEADDALMEKYLEEMTISDEEFALALPRAIVAGTVIPVFAVAAEKDIGVEPLMTALADWTPAPTSMQIKVVQGEGEDAREDTLTPDADGPLLGQVFKTVSDPHVGKLSFVRIFSGALQAKGTFTIARTEDNEKAAQLYRHSGDKHEDIPAGTAGDIVTIGKVEALETGDCIYSPGQEWRLPPIPFPAPMVGVSITPKARGDEQKLGTAIQRLCDEDPTINAARDPQTHELVLRGLGQIHLDITLARMKTRYGVDVNTKPPKIPYLETISADAEGHYRHKKQTGGAGQFAEVYLRLSPTERGSGFEFKDSIVGGAISQSFVGSTEKGVHQALQKGPLAGFPVVDVCVDVYDGKEHPVDSKDIAFQTAGRNAFYEAMEKAKPILLEPVVNMEISFPPEYTGDINGDISGRRGRPTGMEMVGDLQILKAQVPLAEISDYGSTLKAITQGEGFFTMELSHYEPVPSNVVSAVVQRLKAEAADAEK